MVDPSDGKSILTAARTLRADWSRELPAASSTASRQHERTTMRTWISAIGAAWALVALVQMCPAAEDAGVAATLNGLKIVLDQQSGAIRRLEYPGPGTILEADAAEAGLVDAAYPIGQFEPLRLAARHSRGAVIEKSDGRVVIRLGRLGPSRDRFKVDGDASPRPLRSRPTRTIAPWFSRASWKTDRSVPCGKSSSRNFADWCRWPGRTTRSSSPAVSAPLPSANWPCPTPTSGTRSTARRRNTSRAGCSPRCGRDGWTWVGSTEALAFFRGDGVGTLAPRRLSSCARPPAGCACCAVDTTEVKPGQKWSSGSWVLTPHTSGWAKGIEPYRDWVRANVKRRYAMPDHIRDGLGFRTLWMSQNQPNDPGDAVWQIRDLPELAKEAKDHGLREMVLWAWHQGFDASLPAPFPHLRHRGGVCRSRASMPPNRRQRGAVHQRDSGQPQDRRPLRPQDPRQQRLDVPQRR